MNFKRLSMMVKASFVASLFFIATGTMWLFLNQQPASAQAVNDELSFFTSDESALYPHQQNDIDINVTELIESGFTRPVHVTHAGDGSGRLFVVEQDGRIIVVEDGAALNTPFLNIQNIVRSSNDTNGGNEQGLLGVAFHPDYENNGYFYINYTTEAFDSVTTGSTVVARYSVANNNPNLADPDSALILLTIEQPARNHNGGQLLFGPDGYLYIGVGDGGGSNDQFDQAQDKTTLLGTILRIDVNNPTNGKNYGIPPGNPYVNEAGADEIWAIGLRNPWRFSFDQVTGDLYIGDVGQNAREEISYQAANTEGGLNFGWACREGTVDGPKDCTGTFEAPIVDYPWDAGGAVTGGFVYRGSFYPALEGYYFYGDYGLGKIWSLRHNGTTWVSELELDETFAISAFGEDEAGELYVVDYSNGQIRRLADVNGITPNLSPSSKSATPASAEPGATFTYTIRLRNTTGPLTNTLFLNDTLPDGLAYVTQSLTASGGTVDDSQAPTLKWQGTLTPTPLVTLTYQVTATGLITGALTNQAVVTGATISPLTLTKTVFVPTVETIYLPLILK